MTEERKKKVDSIAFYDYFFRGKQMTEEGKKKEPCKSKALVERKLSQERLRKLLHVSIILTEASQTADRDLLEAYQETSEHIDRLIMAEVRCQEKTL